ncbi:UNVERIFIED_CONTAM: putative non-specific lipid-transfer protein 3 [Sesamum radiatum]|uniref:Non-specific lipid-transfer protein n=1 Tax=Sesamum radiatum TaxID=300843 RepID=A0AAW2T2A7_SESRA
MSAKVVYCSVCVMALLVSALAESHANEVSCPKAVALLNPCLAYLTGQASTVTVPCCQGVSTLKDMVKTKPDIKSTCECLKKAAAVVHVIADRAKALPGLCHIQIPVPIDPNVNCSRYVGTIMQKSTEILM